MKTILLTGLLLLSTGYISAQNMDHENHKKMANSEEVEAVKKVLKAYKNALEALDVTGTQSLFTEDADVFENGKYEGSYQNYLDNHIGPELGHFKEFSFIDYKVDVQIEGKIAVAFEDVQL